MDPRGQCCSTPVYLPGGWEVRWDTTAGRPYYLDHNTKQTSWDRPAPPPDLHDQLPRPRQIQAILPTGWEERRDLGSDEAGSPHEDATDDEDDIDDELAAMSENDEPLRKKYGRRDVTQHFAIVAAAAAATAAAAKGTQCPVVRGGLAVRTTAHVQLAHVRRKLTAVKQCIADAGPVYPTGWLNAQQAKGKCWLQNPGNLAGLSAVLVAVCACACWAADLRSVFVAGYNKMMDAITSVWPEAPFYHRARLKNTVGPLLDHVPVCQVRLRRGTHKQGGGCLGGFEWMWFADPGPIWDDDCLADMMAKLLPVLSTNMADVGAEVSMTSSELDLVRVALPKRFHALADMLVTSCVSPAAALKLGIAPGRRKTMLADYRHLVTQTLPGLQQRAAQDVAATSMAAHQDREVHERMRKLAETDRVWTNEKLSAAAARRDILCRHPEIIDVMRQAAIKLGCKSKKGAGMGTPVDASIFEAGSKVGGSKFNKLLAMVARPPHFHQTCIRMLCAS